MSKKKKLLSFLLKKKKSVERYAVFSFVSCGGAKWKVSIFHREIFMFTLAHGNVPGDPLSWHVHSGHHLREMGC